MRLRRTHAAWLGCALLVITALVHLTGFSAIPVSPSIVDTATFYQAVLRPLWVFATIHWLLIATVCALSARSSSGVAQVVLACCGGAILIDVAVLYWFIGSFIGVWLLTIAGAAIAVSAFSKAVSQTAQSELT